MLTGGKYFIPSDFPNYPSFKLNGSGSIRRWKRDGRTNFFLLVKLRALLIFLVWIYVNVFLKRIERSCCQRLKVPLCVFAANREERLECWSRPHHERFQIHVRIVHNSFLRRLRWVVTMCPCHLQWNARKKSRSGLLVLLLQCYETTSPTAYANVRQTPFLNRDTEDFYFYPVVWS